MQKRFVFMLTAILLIPPQWSCKGSNDERSGGTGEQVQPADLSKQQPPPATKTKPLDENLASAKDKSGYALVQLLMFGLMTFERDNSGGSPQIWALAPYVAGNPPMPKHTASVHRGKYQSGSHSWKKVVDSPNGIVEVIFDQAVNGLKADFSRTGNFPVDDKDARKAGWMLHADEIANERPKVIRSHANFKLLIKSGNFETCGLVHNANSKYVCKVKAGNASRAMSEYMLVWWEISDTAEVGLRVGSNTIEIKPTGDTYRGYEKVYDLAFTNIPDSGTRAYKTDHLEKLRTSLFRDTNTHWKNFSYGTDCNNRVQAACLSRYQGWGGLPSGGDRPLCPFIGVGP